jgi:GTP-binding protein Era
MNKVGVRDGERVKEVEVFHERLRVSCNKDIRAACRRMDELLAELEKHLKEGPMFYPGDMVTDQPQRVLAAEIVREKALKNIGKEVPHGIGVDVERMAYDKQKKIYNIDIVIYTEKNSHKGIIIGAGGSRLKKIASGAREDIEKMLDSKVFMQVWVKVKTDWRNKTSMLRSLGYDQV